MAGRIPRHFIDNLLAHTDIVEVINSRVPLKKKGREFGACCPFHNEKTPSFTVSPEKQFYHCFGCGAHGSAISFLMEYERLDFIEAIEALAELAGIEVEREESDYSSNTPSTGDHSDLYRALEAASLYFQRQLKQAPKAVEYFRQRGVTGEIAKTFMLGYAPEGWDNLEKSLGAQHSQKVLLDAGLLSQNDQGRQYDKFRDRVMFPIRDTRGRTVAFGGRILDQGEPKYLNSPETPVFHKSQVLYGLYEARQHAGKLERILVVEGYMDVIALAQYGIRNAVATLGTATTAEHLKRLFRLVPRVTFCFDGDRAGRDAAWKALNQALPIVREGQRIEFLFLPDGEDPDTMLRKEGTESFQQRLDSAMPMSQFLLKHLEDEYELDTIEGRSELGGAAQKLLKDMPESLLKEQLLEAVSELTQIKPDQIKKGLPLITSEKRRPVVEQENKRQQLHATPMRYCIAALLQHPNLSRQISDAQVEEIHELPGGALLSEIVDLMTEEPDLSPAMLMERFRGHPLESQIQQLSVWEPLPDMEQKHWGTQLEESVGHLMKQSGQKHRKNRLQELLSRAELNEEEKAELKKIVSNNH